MFGLFSIHPGKLQHAAKSSLRGFGSVCWVFIGLMVWIPPAVAQSPKPSAPIPGPKRERVFDKRHRSYIPMDLDDALDELDRTINETNKERIRKNDEKAIAYHHGFGTGLRNGWGLWGGSRLAQWFNDKGIFHPDDMSGIILDAWFARVQGKPFDFDEQIRGYQEYWKKAQEAQKLEEDRATQVKKLIPTLLMGLEPPAKPVEWTSLPVRKEFTGPRIRSMVPFGEGVLLTARKSFWGKGKKEDYNFTTPLFYEPKSKSLHPVRCPKFDQIENAVVLDATLFLEGTKNEKHQILAIGPSGRFPIPMPPGKGWIRLGTRGSHLLAVFPKSVWEWDGKAWGTLGEVATELPWCGMPPVTNGDYLYLRDEGHGENAKSLHWLKLPGKGALISFHEDTKLVGPEGPRWEFVWNFAFTPTGEMWVTTGEASSPHSLVRREAKGTYQIALFNGEPTFSGDLLGGRKAGQRLDFEGLHLLPGGEILLAGNQGIYKLDGKRLVPIVGLKRTRQMVTGKNTPTDPDAEDRGNWHLDPSHFLPLGPASYMLGSDWDGVYLVERQADGSWKALCLDEPLSAPVTF